MRKTSRKGVQKKRQERTSRKTLNGSETAMRFLGMVMWKFAKSSKPRTSALNSRPSCASRRSSTGPRSKRTSNARGNDHAIHDDCEDARDGRATIAGAHRKDHEAG